VRLGIIARSEDRGLGLQTWEACLHLNPERVLLVEPQPARWQRHRERYEQFETTRVKWDGRILDEGTCRRWLDGLDVVYTAETPYDERLPRWAAEHRCGVAVHANPEMLADKSAANQYVTWWAPTRWRLGHLPFGTRVVPMPVAADRFQPRNPANSDKPVTFVHSAGHEAVNDRNGTRLFAAAVRDLEIDCRVRVFGQDGQLPKIRLRPGLPYQIDVDVTPGGVANYWEQYEGGDVLVMPRRYGGLCLPVQEALAAGLAVVMTDVEPNSMWPGLRVPVSGFCQMRARCGTVDVHEVDPADLTTVMEKIAADPTWLADLQAEARTWAETHSWEALLPRWQKELERACR
jgi:glycosyltransferase involved in cell wall biosynthesis